MRWFKHILFKLLMWGGRKQQRAFDDGYWRGWSNCLHAIRAGEIDAPAMDTGKQLAYPATSYAPLEQERSTDKVMRPNQVYRQAMQHGAGPHTAAVQAAPRRTVKLSPDSDRR